MGEITIRGKTFPIAGDRPTENELRGIEIFFRKLRERESAAMPPSPGAEAPPPPGPVVPPPDPGAPRIAESETGSDMQVPGTEVTRTVAPREFPDAPSTAAINLGKAHGVTEYPSPIAAGKDFARGIYDPKTGKWFQGSPAMRDVANLPGNTMGSVIAPLSTDDPKQRQAIYVKQIPGAKAVDDKYGNPMIEMPDGTRYYTSGGALDIARAGLGVAGGLAIGATLPVTGPVGLALWGAGSTAAQSVLEDVIAKSYSGDEGNWVNVDKLLLSAGLGALPGGVVAIRNALARRAAAGLPMTDEALRAAGLTENQVLSLTPAIRAEISKVAQQTFDNPQAISAAYREQVAKEAGLTGQAGLTRGELSGDQAQIFREQKLVGEKGPGTTILEERRAAQDAQLTAAQEALLARTGGRPAGQPPLKPEDAQTILKGARDEAKAAQTVVRDEAYKAARDPAAVEAAGGRATAPAPLASQLGRTTREALEADNLGRIVLGESAVDLTPQAKRALEVTQEWSQKRVGPRADLAKTQKATGDVVYDPEGLLAGPPGSTTRRVAMDQPGTATTFPEVTWEEAEALRQRLVGYRDAAKRALKPGELASQDTAAMDKILANFDEHFGPLNPLYDKARAAHAELKEVFKPGGGIDHDAATKTVLKVMQGPQGGAAIVDTMFGPQFSKGQAGQMMDHLNDRVFKAHPEARDAIREMSLRRLFYDAKGDPLTPQKIVTNLERAFGDQELSTYQKLLTGEQMAELRRTHEVVKTLAKSRTPINPPRSGLLVNRVMKTLMGGTSGAVVGSAIGGVPGGITGGLVGGVLEREIPRIQAGRAVNFDPRMYQTATPPGKVPGILGTAGAVTDPSRPPGPADRIMDGLLMP